MNLNQMLIHYCAPTLCKIKPANAFFMKKDLLSENILDELKKISLPHGISLHTIMLSSTMTAILVTNDLWLRKILKDSSVQQYLLKKGYNCFEAADFIRIFSTRIKENTGFPHEIGIILGYPLEDVIEYEKHQGSGCKYCGAWKTYSNVEHTKKCHCKYKTCSFLCENLYKKGYPLVQIIDEYKRIASVA